MREIRMSGLMSGEGKRNTLQRVTAPFLDSTATKRSIDQAESDTLEHSPRPVARTRGAFPMRAEHCRIAGGSSPTNYKKT
jgi:hypothetical protein